MNRAPQKYYMIYSVIKKGENERLFPVSFFLKEEADEAFDKMTRGDESIIKEYFKNETGISINPFLYFEKEIITTDKIEKNENLLSRPSGKIVSDMIPMDYVSKIYFKKVNNEFFKKEINILISEAERGLEDD